MVHGSTLNTQGNTQSLVTATVGADTAFKFVDSHLHERPQLMVQYSARTFASIEVSPHALWKHPPAVGDSVSC